ncbi:MAG: ion transporter [Clostridium sp.]|nr:ion transporter [Clostridium sp.]
MKQRSLKKKIYEIIFEADTFWGKTFDVSLIIAITLSILIVIIETYPGLPTLLTRILTVLEYIFTFFFTLEYVLRIYCSPHSRQYIFSFFGIIDLLSTLPLYLSFFFPGIRYVLVLRSFRLIRIFRVFKLFNFLNEGNLLLRSLQASFNKIFVFFLFVVVLDISFGTIIYIVESGHPESGFTDILTSIYWATVTLTTVGYGDITPVTLFGRFLSTVVMLTGYTIIAVPTGIVSAAIIDGNKRSRRLCKKCGRHLDHDAHFCKHCGQPVAEKKKD